MKTGRIYIIRNELNEKVYIGKTDRPINKRIREHRSRLHKRDSRPLYQQLIADKVSDISVEVIEDNIPLDLLEEREVHYMEVYNSITNGYNYKKGSRLDLPDLHIATLYKNGKTLKVIGKKFGVGRDPIKLRLMEMGIPIRNWNRQQYIKGMSKEVLKHLYEDKLMTSYEIARIFGTSSTTVLKRLKKHKIPVRLGVNRKYLNNK